MGDNPPQKTPPPTTRAVIAPHIVKKGNFEQKMPPECPKMLYTFLSKKMIVMEQSGGCECNEPAIPHYKPSIRAYMPYIINYYLQYDTTYYDHIIHH